MLVLWLHFAIMFFVMLLEFLAYAYYQKKLPDVPRVLWQGAISGIVFCLPFDLLFGKYLPVDSYALGAVPLFFILNAVLLYGLFAANILLMQKARLLHFCIWITVIVGVNEILNLYLHLWTHLFAVPSIEYVIVAFILPLGGAMLIALAWHELFGRRFVFITNFSKR